jgi:hypothetical protein
MKGSVQFLRTLGVFAAGTCFSVAAHAGVSYAITDLGTLGGTSSDAYGIGNSGQVVGKSSTAHGDSHPFLYECYVPPCHVFHSLKHPDIHQGI